MCARSGAHSVLAPFFTAACEGGHYSVRHVHHPDLVDDAGEEVPDFETGWPQLLSAIEEELCEAFDITDKLEKGKYTGRAKGLKTTEGPQNKQKSHVCTCLWGPFLCEKRSHGCTCLQEQFFFQKMM